MTMVLGSGSHAEATAATSMRDEHNQMTSLAQTTRKLGHVSSLGCAVLELLDDVPFVLTDLVLLSASFGPGLHERNLDHAHDLVFRLHPI